MKLARPQHRDALQTQDVSRSFWLHDVVVEQVAPERTLAPRSGIFRDAESRGGTGCKRSARRRPLFAVGREKERRQFLDAGIPAAGANALRSTDTASTARRDVTGMTVHGTPHDTTSAGRSCGKSKSVRPIAPQGTWRSPITPPNFGNCCVIQANDSASPFHSSDNRGGADTELKHEIGAALRDHFLQQPRREGRADSRMPGHRELFAGCKDPHLDIAAAFGREDERALGEVHLARDDLHQRGVEARGLRKHGELVSFERPISEYVQMEITHPPTISDSGGGFKVHYAIGVPNRSGSIRMPACNVRTMFTVTPHPHKIQQRNGERELNF